MHELIIGLKPVVPELRLTDRENVIQLTASTGSISTK